MKKYKVVFNRFDQADRMYYGYIWRILFWEKILDTRNTGYCCCVDRLTSYVREENAGKLSTQQAAELILLRDK